MKTAAPALLLVSMAAEAAPITMAFSADQFVNAGTQYPGLSGPVYGTLSWDADSPTDAITSFTSLSVTIPGHTFGLADVGIASNSGNITAIGALPSGANAVVGNGAANDFLMVFDRVNPAINAFAYSLEGKTNAIWWTPAVSSAQFVMPLIYTLDFYADGFVNAGTQVPGYGGPLQGSISWLAYSPFGRMEQLLDFNFSLFGNQFGLADIGIASQSDDITALGGLASGANAVVGNGAANDFLMLIDRRQPALLSFAFSLLGKSNSIWWTPSETRASYRVDDVGQVPEPAMFALLALALAAMMVLRQRQSRVGR